MSLLQVSLLFVDVLDVLINALLDVSELLELLLQRFIHNNLFPQLLQLMADHEHLSIMLLCSLFQYG